MRLPQPTVRPGLYHQKLHCLSHPHSDTPLPEPDILSFSAHLLQWPHGRIPQFSGPVPSHNQLASPCFDLPHCPASNICSIIVITLLQGPASSFHPLPSVILPDQILRVHEEPHYPEPLTRSRKTFVGKKHASGLTSITIQKVNSVSQMSSRSPRPFVTTTALCMSTCQENLQPPLLLLPHHFLRA